MDQNLRISGHVDWEQDERDLPPVNSTKTM